MIIMIMIIIVVIIMRIIIRIIIIVADYPLDPVCSSPTLVCRNVVSSKSTFRGRAVSLTSKICGVPKKSLSDLLRNSRDFVRSNERMHL